MAYTLKTTGLAATYPVKACLIVNQAGTSVVDLVAGNDYVVDPAVTVGTGTWNGNSRKFFTTTGTGLTAQGVGYPTGAAGINSTTGITLFIAYNGLGAVAGSAPFAIFTNNTEFVGNTEGTGNLGWRAAGSPAWTATSAKLTGKASIVAKCRIGGPFMAWHANHGTALASAGTATTDIGAISTDPGKMYGVGGLNDIGYQGMSAYAVVAFEGDMSEADANALHTDWFAQLIDVSGVTVSLTPAGLSSGIQFGTASITRAAPGSLSGAGGIASGNAFGTATLTTTSPTASFSTPVLKNNAGTVLTLETGVVVNVYNQTTGALIVRKTGLSSNSSGIVTVTDASLVPGTTYAYEVVLSANGRRLPVVTAA